MRIFQAIVCFVLVAFMFAGLALGAEGNLVQLESAHFRFQVPEKDRRLGDAILNVAESARKTVLDQMPSAMEERIGLAWVPTEREFYRQLGGRAHHTLAAAVPSIRRVYLNGEQLQRLDRMALHQTLAHEFVHIYLGRVVGKPIPRWLNEGLAMYVAGEWSLTDAASLAADSLFGRLFPVAELADRFPTDPVGQQEAYRESYSLTAYLLNRRYSKDGVRGLVADLTDNGDKSGLHALLSDPDWLAGFERDWQQQWVRPGRVVLMLTSSGMFWILVALLCIAAYARKRRTGKRREARWAVEEEFGYHDDGFDD